MCGQAGGQKYGQFKMKSRRSNGGSHSSTIIFKVLEWNSKEFEDFSIATKKKPLIFTNTRTKKQIHAVDVADKNKERNDGLKDKRNQQQNFHVGIIATDSKAYIGLIKVMAARIKKKRKD